ncbi:hypothetical protein ACA30_17315 [Virgibacillus soli]|uniref:Uncharacterized protein n=1 Tax=Lederbergia galactosidilytica TaxID=217031 RepID=A0A177ZTI1_9BACI|nr:hypothetical protein ACA30_17315 [Virgibacillus soli]OAK70178.1 hypothetical protein ABB05_12525 [Lederbergia galactosidilytica]
MPTIGNGSVIEGEYIRKKVGRKGISKNSTCSRMRSFQGKVPKQFLLRSYKFEKPEQFDIKVGFITIF